MNASNRINEKSITGLGDLVRDKVTGFVGIVTSRTEWLHGCVRVGVQPQGPNKDGQSFKVESFDEMQLDIEQRQAVKPSDTVVIVDSDEPVAATGGPHDDPTDTIDMHTHI